MMGLRQWTLAAALLYAAVTQAEPAAAQDVSGFVTATSLTYLERAPTPRHIGTLSFGLDAAQWLSDDLSLTLRLFGSAKPGDSESSYIDPAIAKATYMTGPWRFDVGYDTVFWGVVESQRVVDVINQRDLLRSIRGDRVLGQPMAAAAWLGDTTTLSAYVLPRFIPLNYGSGDHRLGLPLRVDDDRATYESSRGRNHVDVAARAETIIDDLEAGVSLFDGTLRQPLLRLDPVRWVLRPHYRLGRQVGLDLQYTAGATLLKAEARYVAPHASKDFQSAAYGLEQVLGPVWGTPWQLSLLAEHNWDSRGERGPALWQNDLFLGARMDFSDVSGTTLFLGTYIDLDHGGILGRAALDTRLTDTLLLSTEALLAHADSRDDTLYHARNIDQLSVSLRWSF